VLAVCVWGMGSGSECVGGVGDCDWCVSAVQCRAYSLQNAIRVCTCIATLLVGRQEKHPACKHRVMMCWCGYLSGAKCRLFAYGPADATASQNPIISCLI